MGLYILSYVLGSHLISKDTLSSRWGTDELDFTNLQKCRSEPIHVEWIVVVQSLILIYIPPLLHQHLDIFSLHIFLLPCVPPRLRSLSHQFNQIKISLLLYTKI